MSKLAGSICLIAGGTGTVGECIVKVFLREGATVIVPSRHAEKLEQLLALVGGHERLITLVADIGKQQGAERIRDEILNRFARLDAVIASLGGTWEGDHPLIEVSIDTWEQYHQNNLTAHFVAARTFLPVLMRYPGSSYTLLGGMSAVKVFTNYSPVAINSAAQLHMTRILMEEMKHSGVRINEVIFGTINTRARAAYAQPEWITADEVGEFIAYLTSPAGRMIGNGILQLGDRPPKIP